MEPPRRGTLLDMAKLAKILDRIEAELGAPRDPPAADPLGLILWENVAYLVDDKRRQRAFDLPEATS